MSANFDLRSRKEARRATRMQTSNEDPAACGAVALVVALQGDVTMDDGERQPSAPQPQPTPNPTTHNAPSTTKNSDENEEGPLDVAALE